MRSRASDSFARASGSRKTEPAEARTTLGLNGLTVPSPRTTPPAPKASAERRIVPRFPGSCTPAIANSGPACGFGQHIFQGEFLPSRQRSHALRRFAGDDAGEQLVGQQQGLDLGAELGQKPFCPGRGRLAEKDCPKPQAAANGFFQDAQAFNGAVAVRGELAAGKGPAQLFDQRIMASLDAAQAGV